MFDEVDMMGNIELRCSTTLAWVLSCYWGPFYLHGLNLIPAWLSNHMTGKVWYEIIYPFLNFNGCTVEVY